MAVNGWYMNEGIYYNDFYVCISLKLNEDFLCLRVAERPLISITLRLMHGLASENGEFFITKEDLNDEAAAANEGI